MNNKPIAGWRVVFMFMALGVGISLGVADIFGEGAASAVFFGLLILTSVYLYSRRFAAKVNGLLERWNFI
jgi:hypothetical protein